MTRPPLPAGYPPQRPSTYQPHPDEQFRYLGDDPAPGWPQPHGQWGYGGWPPPPPPRRPGGLARLLLGLVGGGAALLFVVVLIGAVASGTESRVGEDVSHEPAAPADGRAQPVDPSDAVAVLERNTLYAQGGLANGTCPAQELGDASTEEQTRFYEALMVCLDDEWEPPVAGAGFPYAAPGLVVFDSPVSTPCGSASPEDGRTLAFYCPGDSVLYADVDQMRKFFGSIDVAYAIVIGHEFGHHVQQETGILDAFDAAVYGDFSNRLDLNRRVELQASCMGGLFLGAVADSFPIDDRRLSQLNQVAGSFGDEPGASDGERDHGSGRSNREWILKAFGDNDLEECNTFIAPADQVD